MTLSAGCEIPDDQHLVRCGREANAAVGAGGAAQDPTLVAVQTMTLLAGRQIPNDQSLVRGREASAAVGADGAAADPTLMAAQAVAQRTRRFRCRPAQLQIGPPARI